VSSIRFDSLMASWWHSMADSGRGSTVRAGRIQEFRGHHTWFSTRSTPGFCALFLAESDKCQLQKLEMGTVPV